MPVAEDSAHLFREGNGFELVAVRIADEGAEVGRECRLSRSRLAVARSASGERRSVECTHGLLARRAQGNVAAGIGRRGSQLLPQVEPELRILLAEADRCGALDELGVAERCQNARIEFSSGG